MQKRIEPATVSGKHSDKRKDEVCIEDGRGREWIAKTVSVMWASNNNASEIPICHSRNS